MLVHKTEESLKIEMLIRGIDFEEIMLDIGDAVISERTCVERKGVSRTITGKISHDFVASIKDGRLFEQCQNLRDNYENPIMIIEGIGDLYNDESVDRKSISGALSSITSKYNIKVIPTESMDDTINVLVKLEEYDKCIGYSKPVNKKPKPKTIYESQIYLLTGLLNIGYNKAVELLVHFGNPINVFNEISKSHFIKPVNGRKKKMISVFSELKGFGPIFVEKNIELLTKSFVNPKEMLTF